MKCWLSDQPNRISGSACERPETATVNQQFFLRDDTGNRRFWVAQVGRTREAELLADRDQLWAEAASLEKEGESDNIPVELWPVAAAVADQHMKEDQIAEAVSLKLDELPEFDAVVLSQDMALAIGIEDVTRRGGQIAQSMATGAKRAGWAVKLGRVPGVKSRGGVRHYAAPASTGKTKLYRYSRSGGRFFPFVNGRFVEAPGAG
jgi:hypothetical protein